MNRDGEAIKELCQRRDALDLELSRRVASFEASRGFEDYGSANTIAYLKIHCGRSTAQALELASVARQLPELARVEAAVLDGQISFPQAAVIAELADRVGADALSDHEVDLVAKAQVLDAACLRQEARRVEIQVDQEQASEAPRLCIGAGD